MVLNLLKKDVDTLSCPALVIFSKSASGKSKAARITHPQLAQSLATAVSDNMVTGKALEAVPFRSVNYGGFKHVLVIGLGGDADFHHEGIRQAAAAAYEAISSLGVKEAAIHFDGLGAPKAKLASFARAMAEGLTLASYKFDELKSKKKETKDEPELTLHVVSNQGDVAFKKAFAEGLTLGQCVNFSRRLGDMPGNLMTPEILAENIRNAAQGTGVKVTVWDKAKIAKERMGGLLGVSMGSAQEPRFIIMEYKGGGASKKPFVLVGKGLTFDSGGISIKPSASMEEMKYDMCGGANVAGALIALAKLKVRVNAIALIPASENMPGPAATKPGDVHTARNGKTFEVNNTDAEGRLILADALSYATELEPAAIVDAATLTGAMVVALGNTHTGYFTRNESLNKKILAAADASGEWVWRMPLTDFHVKDMKGTFADLSNTSGSKGAGSATAAAFLEQFVGEGLPWVHFDIAGTGWAVGNRLNYCSRKGASGAMIRTFVELGKSFA